MKYIRVFQFGLFDAGNSNLSCMFGGLFVWSISFVLSQPVYSGSNLTVNRWGSLCLWNSHYQWYRVDIKAHVQCIMTIKEVSVNFLTKIMKFWILQFYFVRLYYALVDVFFFNSRASACDGDAQLLRHACHWPLSISLQSNFWYVYICAIMQIQCVIYKCCCL